MKSFKKLLSVVLAAVLCICLALPVAAEEPTFTDVPDGKWYSNAVERWADAQLIMGYEDGTFGTNNPITRAEVAVIVANLVGLEAPAYDDVFSDVPDGKWYTDYVLACANAGILHGYEDGTFAPNASITREAAFKVVMQALLTDAELAEFADDELDFIDADEVGSWAHKYVAAIVGCGAVSGRATSEGNLLAPKANITRAEFASILNRLIAVYVDKTGEVSVFEADKNTEEAEVTGAGFVVVHADNEDIQATYEIKDKDGDGTEETVVVIIKNDATGQEVREEFAISSKDTEIVLVHGQTDSVNKDVMEEDVVTDMTHEKDTCTNCAVTQDIYEHCQVCGDILVETLDAHPHTFNEDGICECCGMTDAAAMKFNLKVSSNGNYVEANVTNDYAATLTVTPGKVSAAEVTLSASMQDVASLGGGTKHHEDTFTTNMTGDPSLSTWLSNVFTFEEGYIEVTGLTEEAIGYTLTGTPQVKGDDGYYPEAAVITATPNDVEDTRDAWAELTSHVTTSEQTDSDSYVNIANGSYMIVGDDKLCFEKGTDKDLTLDNFSDLGAMEDEIRSKVQLITNSAFESDDYEAKFYLAAGTELAVSNSIATLDDNCTITVSGEGLNSDDFQDVLTNIRDAETTYDMASELVQMINAMVGSADGETIKVDFAFETPVEKDTKFYLGMTANNADGNGTTTVDMEVFDDYSLEINLPMNKLSAKEVTLTATMKDVASLEVEGTRTHTQTINTNMTATGDLNTWMSNAPLFETATINAKIVTPAGTYPCEYVLTSDMDSDWVTITGTTNTAETRAAWQALTAHVTTYTQEESDSYIFIAGESYIDTTTERLVMEDTAMYEGLHGLGLDNFSQIEALKQNIKDSVVLVEGEADVITLHVGAGSTLAISNSVAFTNADTTITIEGIDVSDTLLSDIRTAANANNEELVKKLFNILNELVYEMNGKTVNVTITVGEGETLG